jgi:hypothetical protein
MTHEQEATLVGQVKEPERRVNRTGHLVHFERTPGPCPGGTGVSTVVRLTCMLATYVCCDVQEYAHRL